MNDGNKPKLLLFSHICSPEFVTGAEKLLLLFLREMVHRFHCVLVVPQEGAISEKAKEAGARIVVLDIPLCISIYTASPTITEEIEAMKNHPSWGRLHGLLAEERPDCVLVNTSVHPLPAIAAKAMGFPVMWSLMETIMDRPGRAEAVNLVTSCSDKIIGISHATLEPILAHVPQAPTFMLPPYLIREELLPGSWAYHRLRLRKQYGWGEYNRVTGFMAATIYANKGLEQFIRAMLPIAQTDVKARFLIVGNSADDAYYRSCQKLVAQSGYGDRFLFLPFAEQIQHAFPVMDVVVVPSLVAEGFGMTALEGMLFGKGVVAFASGGLKEILAATGNEEYLVPTGDTNVLTERVYRLLSNDGLLRAVSVRNAATSQHVFGVAAFRARLNELMEQLPVASGVIRSSVWRGSGPTVFLIENGVKRPFVSELSFLQRGYLFEQVSVVPDEELAGIPLGPNILEFGAGTGKSGLRKRRRRRISKRSGRAARGKRRQRGMKRMKRSGGKHKGKAASRRKSKAQR
ncbi:glycosyltransferase [Cohnella soli]|uniref:Glycosyltransferase n=1 Tax=Cohnella soli TaxID=425005 RepID=A0ABW0I2J0_9BACL